MIKTLWLKKIYDTTGEGLASLDISIPDGQIVGILGPNGAGKTTFLKLLAGLITPSFGDVWLDERVPAECKEEISFISCEGTYFPELDAAAHMELVSAVYPKFDKNRFNSLMGFFDLPFDKKLKYMSTGQKAKFEIALGFSKGTKYYLLDEPFLGKDVFARHDFLKLLSATLTGNETILISTHNIDEIEQFLDRAVIFNKGSKKEDIMLDDLREKGKTLLSVMEKACGYDRTRINDYLD